MSDLNSNEYLEMCEQLQNKFKSVEAREKIAFKRVDALKRDMAQIYGLVRAMDNYLIGACDLPDDLQTTIELLISSVKDAADQHLFNGAFSDDDDEQPPISFTFTLPTSSLHTASAVSLNDLLHPPVYPAHPPSPGPPAPK